MAWATIEGFFSTKTAISVTCPIPETMEDEAKTRKERLEALRKRKFRNYETSSDTLRPHTDQDSTVETEVHNITAQVLEEAEKKQQEEVDLFNLAPKKPNWDLKRDVEKKLARLDRRTQTAVAELIRIRLKGESDKTANLAGVVANAVQVQKSGAQEMDDDEE
ncbi:cwf18 pre-mRNA splicing factor-domain-containing protein [Endogone sp. FLAS-F59071]|nr:cwf18 pre-mRNA splicing factor-domain-containing protein [Endogone sp. FLAS-F59071]|eukprot:RUS17666.1 cwf18 pre-mRNA splicing factor-domain-containing protein [Endogone sp. FLAS-F59071]